MSGNAPTAFTYGNASSFNRNAVAVAAPESPYAKLYAQALDGLDSPFAQFLKKLHGVSGTVKVGQALGLGSFSVIAEAATEALQMLARDDKYPRFEDGWARALTYRYRPLEEASPTNRADNTVKEVIQQAEDWIKILFEAMCNVQNVYNKPTSIELNMFKSTQLDKKAVEAACRSILITLLHRCVIGFCGLRTSAYATREDKRLTCKDRLLAVVNALKFDKRICKDVMTEDSKVAFLVHAPLAVSKCKKNQEKGNDVKRDLLAEAAAARRKARASSAEDPQVSLSLSSSPVPVVKGNIAISEGLSSILLGPGTSTLASAPPASVSTVSQDMSVLSSSGFAALNKEHASKKRGHNKINGGNTEKTRRTRVKIEKCAEPISIKMEDDDEVVFLTTKQV
ncbi:hypothetical protein BU23DRAFT_603713 [Bimuria novae-zelandiae CBS 107.79]|uniref:Uncharacterized protein n=1 Tax=Bimuria novae-zelandiae CBS 107.79 TaxID=1447943 RepID=A0A6A5UT94_9PLEO|nr:hypothetical protein BU23DRAFT_603713 [Bimuria novae-zelandiae CBS 107.79]